MWLIYVIVIFLYSILGLWTNINMNGFEKKTKAMYLIGGVIATFILSTILVLTNPIEIQNGQIESKINTANIFLFAAVNAMIIIPNIASVFNKTKLGEITKKQARNKLIIRGIVFVLLVIIEISYIKGFQGIFYNMLQNQGK